jgi:hypothetical protein
VHPKQDVRGFYGYLFAYQALISSASLADASGPFSSHCRVDWQRVARGLDDAESLGAASALVGVACREHAEVHLGERSRADRALELPR